MSAKAFSDIMIAAGFGEEPAAAASHAQHRAHSATASFEAQLAEQQRAYERLRSIQGELKADEDQVAAEVAKLRRRLEEAARGLSAAESRRERLRRELGQTETEINELAKQKAHFTSEIHALTERAAAARENKLQRACGGNGRGAHNMGSSSQAGLVDLLGGEATAPVHSTAPSHEPASQEPNLLGDSFCAGPGPSANASAARLDDLLGLDSPAPQAQSREADAPFDGFGGFDAPQASDGFWASSPLGGPMPQQAAAGNGSGQMVAPSDPFASLGMLGGAMP